MAKIEELGLQDRHGDIPYWISSGLCMLKIIEKSYVYTFTSLVVPTARRSLILAFSVTHTPSSPVERICVFIVEDNRDLAKWTETILPEVSAEARNSHVCL